jgi:hypothetical protein
LILFSVSLQNQHFLRFGIMLANSNRNATEDVAREFDENSKGNGGQAQGVFKQTF